MLRLVIFVGMVMCLSLSIMNAEAGGVGVGEPIGTNRTLTAREAPRFQKPKGIKGTFLIKSIT
jgi:hypothetical protein